MAYEQKSLYQGDLIVRHQTKMSQILSYQTGSGVPIVLMTDTVSRQAVWTFLRREGLRF